MASNTDHLFPDIAQPAIRAGLTRFPKDLFPFGGAGDLLLDRLVPGWSERAEIAVVDFTSTAPPQIIRQTQKPLLFISGSVTSPIAAGHAISLEINMRERSIIYRDPYGNSAPDRVRRSLQQSFPGFILSEERLKQQDDLISCSWISLANIVSRLENKPVDANIQQNLDLFKERVLVAARSIWPHIMSIAATGNARDPIQLTCFQHLASEPRIKFRIIEKMVFSRRVTHEESMPSPSKKTFIIRNQKKL